MYMSSDSWPTLSTPNVNKCCSSKIQLTHELQENWFTVRFFFLTLQAFSSNLGLGILPEDTLTC